MPKPDQYRQLIDKCAKCGACVPVCPLYRLTGRESMAARGKLHLLRKIEPEQASEAFAAIFSRCLQCGACRAECPRGIDIPSLVGAAREELEGRLPPATFPEALLLRGMKTPLLGTLLGSSCRSLSTVLSAMLPEDSGLRIKLTLPSGIGSTGKKTAGKTFANPPRETSGGSPRIRLFSGCFARHLEPGIMEATEILLGKALRRELDTPSSQACCGLAFHSSGKRKEARELAMRNIAAFEGDDGPIITPCASCFSHLSSYETLFADDEHWRERARRFAHRLEELSTFLENAGLGALLAKSRNTETVYYHDSCHLRLHRKITVPPRRLLRSVGGLELVEADGQQCCGGGGLFALHHPDLASDLSRNYLRAIASTLAKRIITSCSGCLLQMHRGVVENGQGMSVQHLAEFLVELLPGATVDSSQNNHFEA